MSNEILLDILILEEQVVLQKVGTNHSVKGCHILEGQGPHLYLRGFLNLTIFVLIVVVSILTTCIVLLTQRNHTSDKERIQLFARHVISHSILSVLSSE